MMLAPTNLQMVVTRAEINESILAGKNAMLSIDTVYLRLRNQNAPPALVEAVFNARADMERAVRSLKEVRDCFPDYE